MADNRKCKESKQSAQAAAPPPALFGDCAALRYALLVRRTAVLVQEMERVDDDWREFAAEFGGDPGETLSALSVAHEVLSAARVPMPPAGKGGAGHG